jgi:hypothetical protein
MCWYSDVVDGDWVIDYTKYPSLLIAAGGSGHAFKVRDEPSSYYECRGSSMLTISSCP